MSGTILITGVAGFLGRYVAAHFAKQNWRVVGIDEIPSEKVGFDSVEYHQIRLPGAAFAELLRDCAPQVCIHCAGCASVGLSLAEPSTDFRGNTVLVFEVLEALRRSAPGCRFLLLSSAAVYGDPAALPVREDQAIRPISPYGYHKRQAELLCEEYARIYGLPTAGARIFSAYGPGLRRQVVWDMCARVLTAGTCELHGTGAESRDFIHAEDVARGLSVLADKAAFEGEIYNLANGCEVTIAELANAVLNALGSQVRPVFDGTITPGNPLHWRADISRIGALGFVPALGLEEGVAGVARWARAQLAGREA